MYRALEGNIIKSCVNCKQQGPNGCVFSDLEQGVLHTLQKVRCAFIFHPGTLLFQEGDSPRGVFILCSGGVKLSISSSEGRVLFVKKVGAGGMLGLCASISGQPHPLAAETTECSYISFVKRKDFVKLVQQCGDACFRIVEQLSDNCNVMRREWRRRTGSGTTLTSTPSASIPASRPSCAARSPRRKHIFLLGLSLFSNPASVWPSGLCLINGVNSTGRCNTI